MQSRRDVLRTGAGAAGAGLAASLAGCSEIPVVGSYFDGDLDYAEWAYDPDTLETETMSATLMDVAAILSADEVTDKGDLRDELTSNYSGELVADDVDAVLDVGQTEILAGSFDGSEVVDAVELSEDGSYEDFDFYADDEAEENALFATDGVALLKSNPYDLLDFGPREELELLIDTHNGDADRFVDVNDDFQRMSDEIGAKQYLSVSSRTESSAEDAADDSVVASGTSAEIDGAETLGRYVLLYKNEDGIDLEKIESEFEETKQEGVELNDISRSGRMVILELTVPTAAFL